MATHTHQNRLANETSPYLLQHANNPVDWQPWGDEAFARAKAGDKPVFLSIGYSTCHWCHVMAHESFENEELAALLNEHFIPIKLDREERPDIDRVYMTFVQATTGSGGWPMSVWLTPDRLPFYGGTYFPPEDRWGRPGFGTVLRALAKTWSEDRERVLAQGAHAFQVLQQFAGHSGEAESEGGLDPSAIEKCFDFFWESFDETWGGFGGAPKFPRPAVLQFLWRVHAAGKSEERRPFDRLRPRAGAEGVKGEKPENGGQGTDDASESVDPARKMAEVTLRRMIAGGINDHIGGGFHRYAVDATWHIPHFEKMLYDQAQIVCAMVEAWQATGDPVFEKSIRDTLACVRRDLTSPEGAFYSAEDADSIRPGGDGHEHGEGAFYTWTAAELRDILGEERMAIFGPHYGVEANGNAPQGADPQGEFEGLNTLIVRRSLEDTAKMNPAEAEALLMECRAALFAVREKRPRPHRDEKVLTAWNGLMISAFARASAVFGDVQLLSPAVQAAGFIRARMWNADTGVLLRSHTSGRPGGEGFAEDHAFLVQGLLDLYEGSFDTQWLEWAAELQDAMDRLFFDEAGGGYFSSSGRDSGVLVRMKEDHDGAEPAPGSVAAMNLIRLGRIFGDERRLDRARRTLEAFSGVWTRAPQALPAMMAAFIDWLRPPRQIVLAGTPGSPDFEALELVVRRRLLPGVNLLAADGDAGQAWLAARAPWLKDMRPVDGRAAAYVCEDFACRLPVTDPGALDKSVRA
ncbi:MAG: thioredoxin domain-containing protein [Opitutaceae bacterium]